MNLQLLCVAVVVVCSAWSVLSFTDFRATIPVRVTTTDGTCPSEEQRAETRRQISEEVLSLFTLGLTEDNPASSCSAIPAGNPSGYYWILPATGPPAVRVYCDFNRQCGCDGPSTWTRVAFLNMSDPDQDCPSGWFTYPPPVRACGRGLSSTGTCISATFSSHGQRYDRVCGRMLGYQNQATQAFNNLISNDRTLDQNYLDGVSLTHGRDGSRQHIWSFASALGDGLTLSPTLLCECSNQEQSWPYNTSFVGNDYFCDSGNQNSGQLPNLLYDDDPLWDGAGCGRTSTCCEFNTPPWFCKTLPEPTSDDLETRICFLGGTSRDVLVQLIELYVQ